MKIFINRTLFLSVLLITLCTHVKAQEIKGDTIFVDNQAEISYMFPDDLVNTRTTPSDAPYDLKFFGGKRLTVTARVKYSKPASLEVIEGDRTHRFVIVYKKNIDYNNPEEIEHDYSTLKKLKDHISDMEARAAKKTTEKNDNTAAPKQTTKKANAGETDAASYYPLLESGNQNLRKKQYYAAKEDFEKAHAKRPKDTYPIERLAEIKQKISEQERKLNDAYANYISEGEKSLKLNKITDAKIAFEQALFVRPDDKVAKKNIALIEDREKQAGKNEALESDYNTAVTAGDKAFQKEDYENARTYYNKAIGLIKNRPGPQEQLKEIDKIIAARSSKNEVAQISKAQKAAADIKEKEVQDLKKKYFAALKSADKLFAKKEFVKARAAYNEALQFGDPVWPNGQIAKIDKLVNDQNENAKKTEKQQETAKLEKAKRESEQKNLQNRYNAVLEKADNFFKAGNYPEAKLAYKEAIALIKNPLPQEQLKKIGKIEAENLQKEKEEKLRLAEEKKLTERYNAIVQQADLELGKTNYAKAKQLYMKALNIKSSEAYPKQKLNDIQNTLDGLAAEAKERKERIAAEAELKKKYDLAISKAKSYLLKEDLVNAQAAYNDAAALKPAEVEPKNQLKIITDKLAAIARQNEIDENYEKQIHIADSLMIAENYESAKDIYKEASGIKKTETYPYSQIKYCDSQIKITQQEEEENKKRNAINKEIENENRFHELIAQADKSMKVENYKDAKEQYSEALKIKPDHTYAKQRMKIASDQFNLSKKVSKNKDVAKNNEPSGNEKSRGKNDPDMASVIPQKQTASPYQFQADPIPYSTEELKTKYPDIDFKLLPPDQPFNEEAVDDSKENTQTYIQVLNDKPRLDIDDKSHKIKLTCQGLNFEDRSVYVKLLIQNNSDNDFLTGSMMLTWTRRSGAHIKLFPLYLFPSSLPIVKPGFEAVIIYVCKSYNIGDDEKLKFELNDRMNKIKLSLSFKGSVYNEESMR